MAPTRLPRYTMIQFVSSAPVVTFWFAHAITIKLFPVNSSAPPTTTRIRPSENTKPARSRTTPKGTDPAVPATTVLENTAPSAMNAPASTASTNTLAASMPAFLTPIASAFAAISAGSSESICTRPSGAGASMSILLEQLQHTLPRVVDRFRQDAGDVRRCMKAERVLRHDQVRTPLGATVKVSRSVELLLGGPIFLGGLDFVNKRLQRR